MPGVRWLSTLLRHQPRRGVQGAPSPKMQRLFEWAEARGAFCPKVLYPVIFDPGYAGVQATAPIAPGETIISVPRKLVLTADMVDNTELEPVIRAQPKLFKDKREEWAQNFRLIMFLLLEDAKGRQSEWEPYLQILPRESSFLTSWPDSLLSELQDPLLVDESRKQLATLHFRWKQLGEVLKQQSVMPPITFDQFKWAYFILSSRGFGTKFTALCPVADFVNHANSQTRYTFGRETSPISDYVHQSDEEEWPKELYSPSLSHLMVFLNAKHKLPSEDRLYLAATASERSQKKGKKKEKFITFHSDDLCIRAGEMEQYLKGSEVCLNYGARSNRSLLSEYGFALESDDLAYDLLSLTVADFLPRNKAVWTFKVRKNVLCSSLLAAVRVLLWKPGVNSVESALDEGDAAFDREVVKAAAKVVQRHLDLFPTTVEQDTMLLAKSTDIRHIFALRYRKQRKEAVERQLTLLQAIA